MLNIIWLWVLLGVLAQSIAGIIDAHKIIKIEEETGIEYNDSYDCKLIIKVCGKYMPLTKYLVYEAAKNGFTPGFIIAVLINNIWGYIIWPIHVPMLLKACKEAHKAFLEDNAITKES